MKRSIVRIWLLFAACIIGTSVPAELLTRAPNILPGTNPQWRDPAFWIGHMQAPDAIVMTPASIIAKNEAYRVFIRRPDPFTGFTKERTPDLNHWWPGFVLYPPDLGSTAPADVAAIARGVIRAQLEYVHSQAYGHVNAIGYSTEEITAFEREMAIDSIPDEITARRGLAVRTTLMRNVPTPTPMQIGLVSDLERRYDMFNVGLVHIARPVWVLGPSHSGEYVLALGDDAYGWVRAEDIAFGDDEAIAHFTDPEEFVVATGDRIMIYGDKICRTAAGWFGMGDRLPRAGTTSPREVHRPVRMTDGHLAVESAWLRKDADVSDGWLPYTRRNVVLTAFKLLDMPYDFTNGYFGRNHETIYRDIFACFGFELPWNGALFTVYAGTTDVALPDRAGKERAQFPAILGHEPFVSLHVAGNHPQLLLGEEQGVPVVFDHHGYDYTGEDGKVYTVRRSCVGQMNNPGITGYMLTRPLTTCTLQ